MSEAYNLLVSGGSDFHGPESRNPFPIGSVELPHTERITWISDAKVFTKK